MALPRHSPANIDQLCNFISTKFWGVSDKERFLELINEASSLTIDAIYFGDTFFTWCKNNSFLDDVPFREAWQNNAVNDSDFAIAWRRYILATMGFHAAHLEGDFVECGVYRGSGIKTVLDYLGGKSFDKTFWGYDTFDYHPIERFAEADHTLGMYERVKERFSDYPQVKLVKGFIPDSFVDCAPTRICYLHIDLNDPVAEVATLDFLFSKVVLGGVVILDDYEWAGSYRAQKIAEDVWFAERDYKVTPLPTGQGMVIKR